MHTINGEKELFVIISKSSTAARLIPFIIARERAHFVAAAYGHLLYILIPARVALLSPLSLCLFCVLFVAFLAQFGESSCLGYC